MRDLHEVVDFRARAHSRLSDRGAIDGCVGADLDIVFDHDVGVLGNLEMRSVGLFREAEAIAAEDGAVLHDDTVAQDDAFADRDLRIDEAVLADARAGADDHVWINDGPRAD